jgi:outer membrane lipoprotein carrier protein
VEKILQFFNYLCVSHFRFSDAWVRPLYLGGILLGRRSCMVTFIGLFIWAQGVGAAEDTTGRMRLEQFLDELTTFSARFEQQLFDEYGGLLESAEGEVAISKPGKFRWEYQQPYSQLIVTDGTTLWIYDVDLEQVSINPFSQGGPGSPAELLVGDVDLKEHYIIAESVGEDSLSWVSLTPRDEAAQYNSVEIGLDTDGIQAMKLRDNLNQLTYIRFGDIEQNGEIASEHFSFVPPPGVDVLQGAGN